MTALPKHKMSVDEYLAWAEGQPGRFELYAGTVYAMTPERAGHAGQICRTGALWQASGGPALRAICFRMA
jgi:Uma2 family endonuclease